MQHSLINAAGKDVAVCAKALKKRAGNGVHEGAESAVIAIPATSTYSRRHPKPFPPTRHSHSDGDVMDYPAFPENVADCTALFMAIGAFGVVILLIMTPWIIADVWSLFSP